MKIDFEGVTWQVELLDVDMNQGDVIAGYTGLSLTGWYKSLLDTDSLVWGKSVRCLYWLMRWQNPQHGPPGPIGELNFAPLKLFAALGEALGDEEGTAAAEEDPTQSAAAPAAEASTPVPTPAG